MGLPWRCLSWICLQAWCGEDPGLATQACSPLCRHPPGASINIILRGFGCSLFCLMLSTHPGELGVPCTCSVPCLAVSPDPQLLGLEDSNPWMGFGAGTSWSGVVCGNVGWLLWLSGLCVCRHHGGSPSSCFMSSWYSVGMVVEFCTRHDLASSRVQTG